MVAWPQEIDNFFFVTVFELVPDDDFALPLGYKEHLVLLTVLLEVVILNHKLLFGCLQDGLHPFDNILDHLCIVLGVLIGARRH